MGMTQTRKEEKQASDGEEDINEMEAEKGTVCAWRRRSRRRKAMRWRMPKMTGGPNGRPGDGGPGQCRGILRRRSRGWCRGAEGGGHHGGRP